MRSNPLDNTRGPNARLALAVVVAGVVLVSGVGYFGHVRTQAAREANVQAALLAQGYGRAEIEPIRGDECWRAREGFRWRTPTASGAACAGPASEVTLYPGLDRPPPGAPDGAAAPKGGG